MAIRDCSNLPDDKVPDWVRRSRERKRANTIRYMEQLKRQKEEAAKKDKSDAKKSR